MLFENTKAFLGARTDSIGKSVDFKSHNLSNCYLLSLKLSLQNGYVP